MSFQKKEAIEQHILLVTQLAVVLAQAPERFFVEKLKQFLIRLVRGIVFFFLQLPGKSGNVAQYQEAKVELISSIQGTLDLLDYLRHSSLGVSPTPLLRAYLTALKCKQILTRRGDVKTPPGEAKKNNKQIPKLATRLELTPTQKKILEHISSNGSIRARDVVEKFSSLSERTVKRSLQQLSRLGLIQRQNPHSEKAAFYVATKGS